MSIPNQTPDDISSTSSPVPFIGLKNKGNTCYLNSILQVLYYCPSFNQELFKLFSSLIRFDADNCASLKVESKENFQLVKELNHVFSNLDENQTRLLNESNSLSDDEIKSLSAVCPQTFISCLRSLYPAFEPYTQQDAQECFHCILNICNSVVLLLNEKLKKSFDLTSYVATESKVVGGRRSNALSVLSSSQNQQNMISASESSHNSKTSTAASVDHKENAIVPCSASTSSQSETSFNERNSLSCLKRKSEVINEKTSKARRLNFDLQSEKENLPTNSSNSDQPSETGSIKRRLGTGFRISSPKRPTLLKNLWKIKPQVSLTKNLSKLGEKLSALYSNASTFNGGKSTSAQEDFEPFISKKSKCDEVTKSPLAIESKPENLTVADFIKDMFQGQLVTTVRCVECESEVHRYETFQDISLPVKDIPSNASVESCFDNVESCATAPVETCSLLWTLNHFTSTDTLSGDNKYFCNKCKRLSEAEQRMRFKQLPPVFTLHLKRFSTASTDSSCTSLSKITSALEIPSSIRFKNWCSDDCQEKDSLYNLFGVVIHSGMSISGGHYLSYVKYNASKTTDQQSLHSYDGQWLEMDDEQVRMISKQEIDKALSQGDFNVPTKSAYMLFYHRSSSSTSL